MFLTKLARRTYSLKCSLDISAVRLFRFICKGMAVIGAAKRQGTYMTPSNKFRFSTGGNLLQNVESVNKFVYF